MRTLRARLLLGTALGTAIVLLVSGIALYCLIRSALQSQFDRSLASTARSFAVLAEQEDGDVELDFDEVRMPEFEPSDHAAYYQVWRSDGPVLARSRSLRRTDLDRLTGTPDAPAYESVTLPDGRNGRSVGMTFVPRSEYELDPSERTIEITLVIARGTTSVERTLAYLRWLLIVVGLVAVSVMTVVLAWSVQRGLRPVGRLAGQIAAIGQSDLSIRIDVADAPRELLPIVDRLNDLLARLEAAFTRERQFTADVAHELRTPLAGVRSMLEVALTKPRTPDDYRNVMQQCLQINHQMHQLVENLLALARADANQLQVARGEFDFCALVRECWRPLAAQAEQGRLTVNWRMDEPCTLSSDRDKLCLVIQNILSNAVTYTNEGGHISIETACTDAQIDLTVTNTGSEVAETDADRVFDRFWRAQSSRAQTGQHFGLGLSLCKTLTEALGGSIEAHTQTDDNFTVIIRLPT